MQKLLLASWVPKTCTNYEIYIRKWMHYCQNKNITNPSYATYEQAMLFLVYLFHKESCNYSAIAVDRSALPAILPLKKQETLGECQKVSKMSKGIFKLKSTFPKYTVIYDPDIILTYIDVFPNNTSLLLEVVQKKLCTLLFKNVYSGI